MLFILYRHSDGGLFHAFPKISEYFSKISEDSLKLLRTFPKISEDYRRLPKIAVEFRGRPEYVSMMHQRISVQFQR